MAKTYPWGGFKNGRIPTALLTTVRGEPFEREAAGHLVELEQAFTAKFGYPAIILQGYRALGDPSDMAPAQPTQWGYYNLYRKTDPLRASYPGTSPHGYARSADFASGVDQYGSQEKDWMNANAPAFGWHPTGDSFPRKEAWHFDYIPGTANPTASAALLEADMPLTEADFKALANYILNYPAYDNGPTLSEAIKQLVGRVSVIGDTVQRPVLRDGKQVAQIQDNADTGTLAREILAKLGTGTTTVNALTGEQLTKALEQLTFKAQVEG